MKAARFAVMLCTGLVAGFFVSGCLPVTSKVPVGTTSGLGADPALIGTWQVVPEKKAPGEDDAKTDDDGPGFIHFLVDKTGAMTALVVSTGRPGEPAKNHGEWSVYAVSTAHLGDLGILNALPVSTNGAAVKADDITGHIPMRYTLGADGTLSLYMIDEDAAKAAIQAGKIAGTISDGKYGDVTLTAPADALDAFFSSEDGTALFSEKLVTLKKVE